MLGERECGDADGATGEFRRISDAHRAVVQDGFPLSYVSPNAPTKAEVLGTWMLSILSGHRRYSQVTAIRYDGVNPGCWA